MPASCTTEDCVVGFFLDRTRAHRTTNTKIAVIAIGSIVPTPGTDSVGTMTVTFEGRNEVVVTVTVEVTGPLILVTEEVMVAVVAAGCTMLYIRSARAFTARLRLWHTRS